MTHDAGRLVLVALDAGLALVVLAGCDGRDAPSDAVRPGADRIVDETVRIRVDSTLSAFVERGDISGVSALVWEKGEEVYFNAFGMADREADRPMTRETIVQIFSMTKPTVGVALMSLFEEGAFALDDPLAMYMTDICTTSANLTKTPSLSIPAGSTSNGLPVGVQISGDKFTETTLLRIAAAWERDHT